MSTNARNTDNVPYSPSGNTGPAPVTRPATAPPAYTVHSTPPITTTTGPVPTGSTGCVGRC
ncbi:hypothetical protein ACFW9U_23320 [Rhodococcus aetherivorans]|uniref:hypothetical protein n=1 Tax=Rhodococcus aetherivorans TaxID=191292 RepID=UPI00367110FD